MNVIVEKTYPGVVERFGDNKEKQPYGFISANILAWHENNLLNQRSPKSGYFFHLEDCNKRIVPSKGDLVFFTLATGKDGRPKARNVYNFSKQTNNENDSIFLDLLADLLGKLSNSDATTLSRIIWQHVLSKIETNNCNFTLEQFMILARYNATIKMHVDCANWFILKSNLVNQEYNKLMLAFTDSPIKEFKSRNVALLLRSIAVSVDESTFELTCRHLEKLASYTNPSTVLFKLSLLTDSVNTPLDPIPLISDVNGADEYQQKCCLDYLIKNSRTDLVLCFLKEHINWSIDIRTELSIAEWLAGHLVNPWTDEVIKKLVELKKLHLENKIIFDNLRNDYHVEKNNRYSFLSLVKCLNPDIDAVNIKRFFSALNYVLSLEDQIDVKVLAVKLWIHEYTDNLPDEGTLILFKASSLPDQEQRLYLKRLFWKYLHAAEKPNLDFLANQGWTDLSTRFVLNMLTLICRKNVYNTAQKFDEGVSLFLSKNIVDCGNIPLIGDYFDFCSGRMGDSKRFEKPRNINFCEGRKYQPKQTNGEPVSVKWWCGNQNCNEPSITLKFVENWKDFTLWDFAHILNFNFDMDQYQKLNGYINRVLKFLAHLKCRTCGVLLYPVGQSSFSFYRVTRFSCSNQSCSNKEIVYLTHCLNGSCNGVIDSREVAQCPNSWYICKFCLSCCTTEKLQQRIANLECHSQSTENLPSVGHTDNNEIYCPQCSNKLVWTEDCWNRCFDKLKSIYIKEGIRKDGARWFLFRRSNTKTAVDPSFLQKLQKMGANLLPDESTMLISLKIKDRMFCEECDYSLDMAELRANHEFDRLYALEKAHPELSINTKI